MQIIRAVEYDCHPHISDKNLKENRIPSGFRLLFTEDMRLVEPAFFFLLDTCAPTGKMRSENTQKTYADHLYEAFSYFEAAEICWNEVDIDDLRAYSVALHSTISSHTRQLLERRTIKARMRLIVQFYEWAFGKKLINESMRDKIINVSAPIDNRSLAHLSSNKQAIRTSSLLLKDSSGAEVDAISRADLPLLMHELGPLPPDEGQKLCDSRPTRTRLAATVSINSGMRIDEVIGLEKWQILSLKFLIGEPLAPVALYLTRTKGLRPRTVYLPSWLVGALHWYIDNERQAVIDAAKKKGKFRRTNSEPQALFLNGFTANPAFLGEAVKADTFQREMREACLRSGLVRKERGVDPNTNELLILNKPKYTFHGLRHTYAITLYSSKTKQGDKEPWKTVQASLGHKSLKTTVDTYLRSIQIDEAAISDALISVFEHLSNGAS